MIENNRQVRVSICDLCNFIELRVIKPAIQRHSQTAKDSNRLPDPRIYQQMSLCSDIAYPVIRMPTTG